MKLTPPARVYLAGPMRGRPDFNVDAFEDAAGALRSAGFEVWSPVERDLESGFDPRDDQASIPTLAECMERDLPAVRKADAVALLPGWRASEGVAIEIAVAKHYSVPLYEYPELRPLSATILAEAEAAVYGDRELDYGHPADDMLQVAYMWTGYLRARGLLGDHQRLEAADVPMMMLDIKRSRLMYGYHRDSVIDIAGWAECLARIRQKAGHWFGGRNA